MEEIRIVCQNPWCKGTFTYKVTEGESKPTKCPMCRSFNDELSAGITWTDKKYDGPRNDGRAHPISVNVSRYTDHNSKKW